MTIYKQPGSPLLCTSDFDHIDKQGDKVVAWWLLQHE
jgi:hypothetical protein